MNVSLHNWWYLSQVPHCKQAEDPDLGRVNAPGQYQGVSRMVQLFAAPPAVTNEEEGGGKIGECPF